MRQVSRRQLMAASAGIAGFTFLPARLLGRGGAIPPSEKLNIAFIGIGVKSQHASQNGNSSAGASEIGTFWALPWLAPAIPGYKEVRT